MQTHFDIYMNDVGSTNIQTPTHLCQPGLISKRQTDRKSKMKVKQPFNTGEFIPDVWLSKAGVVNNGKHYR